MLLGPWQVVAVPFAGKHEAAVHSPGLSQGTSNMHLGFCSELNLARLFVFGCEGPVGISNFSVQFVFAESNGCIVGIGISNGNYSSNLSHLEVRLEGYNHIQWGIPTWLVSGNRNQRKLL
jgi:hypothetical protein